MGKGLIAGLLVSLVCCSSAYPAQNYCGRIKSLPDGFVVKATGGDIYFASDNSAPGDPKDVLGYLTTQHKDAEHSCYCITGSVADKRFTSVSGLKKCGGAPIK